MSKRKYNKTVVDNNGDPQRGSMSEVQKLRDELFDEMKKQRTEVEEIKRITGTYHADCEEKFKLIQGLISESQPDKAKEKKDVATSSSNLPLNNLVEKTPEIAKSFVVNHVIMDAFEIPNEQSAQIASEDEEHFGVKWILHSFCRDNILQIYLSADYPAEYFEIKTEIDLKIIGNKKPDIKKTFTYSFQTSDNYGKCFEEEFKQEDVKDYLVDGNLTAEAHVRIIETEGLRKEEIRSFDESVKEDSDVVLVVNERKFFVNKKYLALHSSYFKDLFFKNFAESEQSEVRLHGIDPEDFHFFLEVLHGESAIDESNVEGITLLAHLYRALTPFRRCEEFMMEKSKKTLKRKIQMADQYYMDKLKKKCFSEIKTSADFKAVVPNNYKELQHSSMVALLEKSMELRGFQL